MMFGSRSRSRERGVSEIVGTILMLGVVVAAITIVAAIILPKGRQPQRGVTLDVEVENTADAREVKLTIKHVGGDPIPSPSKNLLVRGGENAWVENTAYERPGFQGFSGRGAFEFKDNAILFIYHVDADVRLGDSFRVVIYDYELDRVIHEKIHTV